MDVQLKRRLIIAMLLVGIIVIFFPILFTGSRETPENAVNIAVPSEPPAQQLEGHLQPIAVPITTSDQTPIADETGAETASAKTGDESTTGEKIDMQAVNSSENPVSEPADIERTEEPATNSQVQQIFSDALDEDTEVTTISESPVSLATAASNLQVREVREQAIPREKPHAAVSTQSKKITTTMPKVSAQKSTRKHIFIAAQKKTPAQTAQLYQEAWVVQLGSFLQVQNANALIKQLRGSQFKAFGYNRAIGKDIVNRVYIGPFSQLAVAEKTRDQLRTAMHIEGIVVRFNPTFVD